MDGEKLAWLAGFMDGEGSFYAILEKRPGNRSGYRIPTIMDVANTNVKNLERVIEVVGSGKMNDARRSGTPNPNHKPIWKVTFAKQTIISFLPKLIPLLVGKKAVAIKILELAKLTSGRGKTYTQDEWNVVLGLYNETRALNKRGTQEHVPVKLDELRPKVSTVSDRRCCIEGCYMKYMAKNYCRKHYRTLANRERRVRLKKDLRSL